MATKDPEKRRAAQKKYRAKKHAEKFGENAGDMRGRHSNHAKGPANARWNNGLATHEDGYLKIRVGKGHPLADPNGYTYLHLIVWLAAGNQLPETGELIHHKNEIKTDNRIENLELKTRVGHAKHHDSIRGRDGQGRFPPADLRVRQFPTSPPG